MFPATGAALAPSAPEDYLMHLILEPQRKRSLSKGHRLILTKVRQIAAVPPAAAAWSSSKSPVALIRVFGLTPHNTCPLPPLLGTHWSQARDHSVPIHHLSLGPLQ